MSSPTSGAGGADDSSTRCYNASSCCRRCWCCCSSVQVVKTLLFASIVIVITALQLGYSFFYRSSSSVALLQPEGVYTTIAAETTTLSSASSHDDVVVRRPSRPQQQEAATTTSSSSPPPSTTGTRRSRRDDEAENDDDNDQHPSIARMRRLHDQTVEWSTDVRRMWLELEAEEEARDYHDNEHQREILLPRRPPAQVLLTNYGWNHPNRSEGLTHIRSSRSRLWLQGILNHPWFHPTAWEDYTTCTCTTTSNTTAKSKSTSSTTTSTPTSTANSTCTRPDPSLRYYIFLDVETCFEANWPNYGRTGGFRNNVDKFFGRSFDAKLGEGVCYHLHRASCRPYLEDGTMRRAAEAGFPPDRTVVIVPDCRGYRGRLGTWRAKMTESRIQQQQQQQQEQQQHGGEASRWPLLSLVSLSAPSEQMDMRYDQGLPPPAIKPIDLTAEKVDRIESCADDRDDIINNNSSNVNETSGRQHRPYLLTFTGNFRKPAREALRRLHDGRRDILLLPRNKVQDYFASNDLPVLTYEQILERSLFAAVPRGDNLFSYRFAEVLSAGAIPVVYSDGWVLPFRRELVDWENECAVRIPEDQVINQTLPILETMSNAERCRRRKRCYEIYKKYMETHEGTVAGVIEGLERVLLLQEMKEGQQQWGQYNTSLSYQHHQR